MLTLAELNTIIQQGIEGLNYPSEAAHLYDPVRYTLEAKGKRLRPTLVLMAANLYTDDVTPAVAAALGIEMCHNQTLLHDDVIDNAPERRGRPTVHVKWNEKAAILSGDAMTGLAYRLIAETPQVVFRAVNETFTTMFLEVYEGQQYDMEFETRDDVTVEEYIEMIRLKTSILLGRALQIGALIGLSATQGANATSHPDIETLFRFGERLGLAFQLQDDWLDCWGDPNTFGKRIGGDILCNKKTFLLINAMKMAAPQQLAVMQRELNPATAIMGEEEKIEFFKQVYKDCGAEKACREAISRHHQEAIEALKTMSVDENKLALLKALAAKLENRNV